MDTLELLPQSASEHITPGRAEILSIFPMELSLLVPHAGPQFTYIHPPADRNKKILMAYNPKRTTEFPPSSELAFTYKEEPVTDGKGFTRIVLYDTYQLVQDWTQDKPTVVKKDIPVKMVVEDLVRCWCSGRLTDSAEGGPGIAVYEPKIRLQEQLDALWHKQSSYFRGLVFQADRFFETKQWGNITNLHRTAAEYVGGEARPWYQPLSEGVMKSCPACQTKMERLAIVCGKCNTNIVKFAKDMQEIGVKIEDPVLDHLKLDFALIEKTSGKAKPEAKPEK